MNQGILNQIKRLESIHQELEKSLEHTETSINHLKDMEVPRSCAHILSIQGHLAKVDDLLKQVIIEHADHSKP